MAMVDPNTPHGSASARRALDLLIAAHPSAQGLASTLGRELNTDGRELLLNIARLDYVLMDVVTGVATALARAA